MNTTIYRSMDQLFSWFRFYHPSDHEARRGYVLLGMPGSVRDGGAKCLFVYPSYEMQAILAEAMPGVPLGGFRCIRSAELMEHGLLPIYAFDLYGWRSVLVAMVMYSEYDRFTKKGETNGD